MSDDLWSQPDRGDIYRTAASPSENRSSSGQDGPALPWHRSRIKEEQSRRAQRDARFMMFGGLGGLAMGTLTAIVLAITLPDLFGSLWIATLVALTGVVAGIFVGVIPGLRFHAGKLK